MTAISDENNEQTIHTVQKLIPNNLRESDVKVKKAYCVSSSNRYQPGYLVAVLSYWRQVQMVQTKQKTEKHRYLFERRC